MKNRTWDKKPNGKFWCWHTWKACGEVGKNWDILMGVYIPCRCIKCDKRQKVLNRYIEEVPDRFINNNII